MEKKRLLLVSALSVLALSSCTQPAPAPASTPASTTSGGVSGSDVSASDVTSSVTSDSTASYDPFHDGYYTFNDFTTVSPSNWNELTYQDNNDTQIMTQISGSFFKYDYQFDEDGEIIPGGFVVAYDGATGLEDITAEYAGNPNYAVPAEATKGFAYKITLRDDLKWDDGTPIKAADFVYTMKEQENPDFQNYRADSFYNGSTVIHNALNYLNQGQSGWFASKDVFGGKYDETLDEQLVFHTAEALATNDPYDGVQPYIRGALVSMGYGSYVTSLGLTTTINALLGLESDISVLEGKTLAQIKASAELLPVWNELIGEWQTDPGEELDFFVTHYTYPELSFDKVGIFVGDAENELIVVLDNSLVLLNEDGSLNFKAAYNFSSLPLVKQDLYEANKVAPATEDGLWTSKYNSSVETSASWGPYKLTFFQAGKQYVLERNEYYYGYNMPENNGLYQTDSIVCDTIANYDTAFLAFEAGDIDGIGLDVSRAADYKNSKRAYFTGDEYVGSLQLQSDGEALKEHETEGVDKEMLLYKKFRQAISVGINRADYTNKCTTASLPGYGLFNSYHYYDVEHAGVYRNEDVAKEVLCEVYGINVEDYESLEEAYAQLDGGNNLELARQLVTEAYNEAVEAGTINGTDVVKLVVGAAAETIATQRVYNYLNAAFKEICVGTPLEGRIELEANYSYGDDWADSFRNGAYEICTGGWSGAAWDPGYFLLAYLDPRYMYSQAWDTTSAMLTLNPFADGNDEHEYTMSLMDWYKCLNGVTGMPFNWAEGQVETEVRLRIIAAVEGEILKVYYTVPLYNYFGASLLSYKVDYISYEHNTFMGYGGMRYMRFNYTDEEWLEVKGTFNYKE